MMRPIAVASFPLAFLALTMCGSGDAGNGSGSSSSGSSSGSSSSSSSSGTGSGGTTSGSSGSGSGSGGSGSGSSSGASGGGSGSSSTSSSGSSGSSGSTSGSSGGGSGSGSGSGSGDDGGPAGDDGGADAPAGPFTLTSSGFLMAPGSGAVNVCFASGQTHGTGDNSPPLAWSGAPADTQSFAVSLHDTENDGVHWVMWNIPASVTSLPAMLPSGAMPGAPAPAGSMQRSADWVVQQLGADQYAGPGAGPPVRAYQFQVWALSAPLTVTSGDTTATIFQTLQMTSTAHATLAACGDIMADCGACDLGQYATR